MFHRMVASQAELTPGHAHQRRLRKPGLAHQLGSRRAQRRPHSTSAPHRWPPSQLAHSVADTSGWRFSQAAFSSANTVQQAMAEHRPAHAARKGGRTGTGAGGHMAFTINANPVAVSTDPATARPSAGRPVCPAPRPTGDGPDDERKAHRCRHRVSQHQKPVVAGEAEHTSPAPRPASGSRSARSAAAARPGSRRDQAIGRKRPAARSSEDKPVMRGATNTRPTARQLAGPRRRSAHARTRTHRLRPRSRRRLQSRRR